MNKGPSENYPGVLDVQQLAEALHLPGAGAYNLLKEPDFPTLKTGGRRVEYAE